MQACHYVDEVTGWNQSTVAIFDDLCQGPGYGMSVTTAIAAPIILHGKCWKKFAQNSMEGRRQSALPRAWRRFAHFSKPSISGEHVVAPRVMYHGSQDWLRRISQKRRIGSKLVRCGQYRGFAQRGAAGQNVRGLDRVTGQSNLGCHRYSAGRRYCPCGRARSWRSMAPSRRR